MSKNRLLLFVDCNILIEALFVPMHPAVAIALLAANKEFDLVTCALVVEDIEAEVFERVQRSGDLSLIDDWAQFKKTVRLQVVPNPPMQLVIDTKARYLAIMRHAADIPVLASAIEIGPSLILSDNTVHFNQKVAARCGLPIWSSQEFLFNLVSGTLKEKLKASP